MSLAVIALPFLSAIAKLGCVRCWTLSIVILLDIATSSCSVLPQTYPDNVIISDAAWETRSLTGVLQDDVYIHPTNVFRMTPFPIGLSGHSYYKTGWVAIDTPDRIIFFNIFHGSNYSSHLVQIANEYERNKPPIEILDEYIDNAKRGYAVPEMEPCVLLIEDASILGLPAAYAKLFYPESPIGSVRVSVNREKRPVANLPANCKTLTQSTQSTRYTDLIVHVYIVSLKDVEQLHSNPPAKFLILSTAWSYELNNWGNIESDNLNRADDFDDGMDAHAEFVARIELCGSDPHCLRE